MRSGVSIAIVSRNRPAKLKRCLESVCKQTQGPDEVLIIDNDIEKSAYPVFKQHQNLLPLKYYLERRPGVPFARNKALFKAKTRYLGFVDDDCILDKSWVSSAMKALTSQKGLSYVCGKTLLYNKKNIIASAQFIRERYWYLKKLTKNNKTSQEHLDTKNVVFDRSVVISKAIKFDPNCSIGYYDSADYDFGISLSSNLLKGVYVNSMKLMHEETNSLKRFILRGYSRGRIAGYINQKWKFGDTLVDLSEKNALVWLLKTIKKFPLYFKTYTKNLNISMFSKILLICLIRSYELAYLKGYISYNKKV